MQCCNLQCQSFNVRPTVSSRCVLLRPSRTQTRRPGHAYAPARQRGTRLKVQATIDLWQTLSQLKGGASSVATFLETAPPPLYLVYMLAAGFGLPCSEDALVVWVGSNIVKGKYGGLPGIAYVLGIIYFGVVVSDLVTFYLGVALQKGFFKKMKESLFSNSKTFDRAVQTINKRSRTIGAIQRFSVGFRGPLCLVCGFTGVPATTFALGAAIGALGTMPIQLTVGYFLRDTPNLYLTALAIMSGPNLCGQLLGPILSATGLYFAGKNDSANSGQTSPVSQPDNSTST